MRKEKRPGRGAIQRGTTGTVNCNPLEQLLPRLERVKQTGADQYIACCPAHEDRSPSLSIKRVDDRVLIHCFAGCCASDVLAAVGLSLADLYDRPLGHYRSPVHKAQRRRNDQALEFLKALKHEIIVTALAADRTLAGYRLTDEEHERVHQAHQAIMRGLGLVMNVDTVPDQRPAELRRPSDYLEEIIEEIHGRSHENDH